MPRRCYLFIDVQNFMFEGEGALPSTERFASRWKQLLTSAREHAQGPNPDTLIVHVQHHDTPEEYGTPAWELYLPALEGEKRLDKKIVPVFDANPIFAGELRAAGVQEVVVAGCQSDYCVRGATRGALKEGFDTVLLSGAHHTEGETFEAANRVSREIDEEMNKEGAKVVDWDQYQW